MSILNMFAIGAVRLATPFLPVIEKRLDLQVGFTAFLFHEVTNKPSPFLQKTKMYVDEKTFLHQVDWITSRFEMITIQQLLGKEPIPQNAAIITFDDAWSGIRKAIERVLQPRGVPAIIFTNMCTIEGFPDVCAAEMYQLKHSVKLDEFSNSAVRRINAESLEDDREFQFFQGETMTKTDLDYLNTLPGVYFGNHLYRHFPATSLSELEFEQEVTENLVRLNRYDSNELVFAFPFGNPGTHFQKSHVDWLFGIGYKLIFSTEGKRVRKFERDQVIPRISFASGDNSDAKLWWSTYKNQILDR